MTGSSHGHDALPLGYQDRRGFATLKGLLLAECPMKRIDYEELERLFQLGDQEASKPDERRRYDRFRETLDIKVTWPGKATVIGKTRDFSDGGTFICVEFEPHPPAETTMLLQVDSLVNGHEAPVLKARVVRVSSEGIAFEFIRDG
jgi:hypothetical protein